MDAHALRALALSLPEAEERETWGEATFRVRDKIFAILAADEETVSVKASHAEQAALVARDPDVFAISRYTGRFGWTSVRLAAVDPEEMRELVTETWRRTAPKRLAAGFAIG
jgi:hypothetical protein